MDPIGSSVYVAYDDVRIRAVSDQIEVVQAHVALFDKNRTKNKTQEKMSPEPFYELVARVKKTIRGRAFGHMASGIGVVQDLILNNAHKFSEVHKKKLMAEEKFLGDARLSREGAIMPIMGFGPRTQAAKQLFEQITPPATAILLSGFVPQSLDGKDPFERRSKEDAADDRFFASIASDEVKGSECDCDASGVQSDDEEECGELEEWERDILDDFRDDEARECVEL